MSDGSGDDAECGEADVPADWNDRDGARVHVFVKRIGNVAAPTQMWMLNGGPGASGADFEPIAERFSRDGSLVFYLPDHRGTGRSSRVGCAAENDASPGGFAITDEEWGACEAELRSVNLDAFTTTQAARDLAWAIDDSHREGQTVHVWGGSYGTRWAQRYLQVRPDQATSVTLMGTVTATRSTVDYDAIFDRVGREFLARCSRDPYCGSRLGTRAQEIWDALDAGLCAEAELDKPMLRSFFAALLLSSWYERALIPATLYRLGRCNAGDVAALQYLGWLLRQPTTPSTADRLHSRLLGLQIDINEMWPTDPPSLAQLQADVDATIISPASSVRIAERVATWPSRHPLDEYAGAYPDAALPVLVVNGEYDPATPIDHAREVASHYANATLLVGPDATHSFVTPTRRASWCFMDAVLQFARMPSAPLDCTADMLAMDFRGTPELAAYFGTTDLWDGGPSLQAIAPPLGIDELRRLVNDGAASTDGVDVAARRDRDAE